MNFSVCSKIRSPSRTNDIKYLRVSMTQSNKQLNFNENMMRKSFSTGTRVVCFFLVQHGKKCTKKYHKISQLPLNIPNWIIHLNFPFQSVAKALPSYLGPKWSSALPVVLSPFIVSWVCLLFSATLSSCLRSAIKCIISQNCVLSMFLFVRYLLRTLI
jgi:hypothetical protein